MERALIHVGGPGGSGKTALVEAILGATDGPVLAARCVRDDRLGGPGESSPRTHAELRRYLQAGADAVAVFAVPGQMADPISCYETDLMSNYSEAVILEGDNPLEHAVSTFGHHGRTMASARAAYRNRAGAQSESRRGNE